MTSADTPTPSPEDGPEETGAAVPETAGPAEAAAPDAAVATPEERVHALETEVAELKDRLLRALAETENVRRRAERTREDTAKYAIANFAREMVTVADNLRRALGTVDAEARRNDDILDNLVIGVEMTEKAMLDSFAKVGIQPVEAMGRRFDHNYHEAMFEVPDPSVPAGTVVHEMERGFVIAERLLRPAKVGIAKGGPKEPAPTDDAAAPTGGRSSAYDKPAGAAGKAVDQEL